MDGGSTEMMIVMREDATSEEVQRILERLDGAGAGGHVSTGDIVTVIAVSGENPFCEHVRTRPGLDG